MNKAEEQEELCSGKSSFKRSPHMKSGPTYQPYEIQQLLYY